ncbi:MAG: hypothetical protein ACD_19C00079G0050 [uncultured bacterium]|nr:MAG: hypothetical protein ACD_19C00079G0050 [uncultured bacterium]
MIIVENDIAVIGTIQLVDLGMKVYIFKGADKYNNIITTPTRIDPDGKTIIFSDKEIVDQEKQQDKETTRNRQRQVSTALAMLIVGIPLYKYHWRLIKKES